MKSFWSYISNGKYSVGCTGGTVYVYDADGIELAKFKDISYAYTPAFSPDGKILAVKSTDGRFAIYSLEELRLIKKFRCSKVDGAQDDGFCFSKDGKQIINIEHQTDDLHWAISVYSTDDFRRESQLIIGRHRACHIEYDEESDCYYVLCSGSKNYVAKFENNKLEDKIVIPYEEYEFYDKYKTLERMGFTKKAWEWSELECRLEEIRDKRYTVAELHKRYKREWKK